MTWGSQKGKCGPSSEDEGEEGDAYENLAEAKDDLVYFKKVLDKKKKKLVEAVNGCNS